MEFLSNPTWTKQGTIIRENISASEAIQKSGLDWKVIKQPLERKGESKNYLIEDSVALVREDTNDFFAIANKNYKIFQNEKVFDFVDPFIDKNELMIDSIVSHSEGKIIILACKVNMEPVEIGVGDLVECFLIIKNEHTAKGGLTMQFMGIRLVCTNGMTTPETMNKVKLRHTGKLLSKVEELKQTLSLQKQEFSSSLEIYREMLKYNLPRYQFQEFLQKVFATQFKAKKLYCLENGLPDPKIWDLQVVKEVMKKYIETCEQMPSIEGTLFSAVQAVSNYYSHTSTVHSQLFGSGASIMANSVKQAVGMMR